MNAVVQAPTTTIKAKAVMGWELVRRAPPRHTAPRNRGTVACQRRYWERSECQPFQNIAARPTRNGTSASEVTAIFGNPVARLRIVGNLTMKP